MSALFTFFMSVMFGAAIVMVLASMPTILEIAALVTH